MILGYVWKAKRHEKTWKDTKRHEKTRKDTKRHEKTQKDTWKDTKRHTIIIEVIIFNVYMLVEWIGLH